VAVAVANAGGGGFGGSVHVLHAMLTFLSCGLYLPIWIICIIIDAVSASNRRSATAVSLGGAPVYPSPVQPVYGPPRPIQTPQVPAAAPVNSGKVVAIVLGAVVGVFFGLILLGLCVEHPWLLIVMTPGSIAAAMLFWRHCNNKLQRSSGIAATSSHTAPTPRTSSPRRAIHAAPTVTSHHRRI